MVTSVADRTGPKDQLVGWPECTPGRLGAQLGRALV